MAIEAHVVDRPHWLASLVDDVVLPAVTPLAPMGHLGYCWSPPGDPANSFAGWDVAVYPAPAEVKGGGLDGTTFVPGFRLDLGQILTVFTTVERVVWHCPSRYNGDLDGPSVDVRGSFAGKHVRLRLFTLPPPNEPVSYYLDPTTGEAWTAGPTDDRGR